MRENILAFIEFLKSNPAESQDVEDLKVLKLRAETKEREAKAEEAQLDLDVRRGELISRKDMYREWTSRCVELRAALLGLPNELGFRFTNDDTRVLVEEVSDEYVRKLLETWSRDGIYTPSKALDAERIEGAQASSKN